MWTLSEGLFKQDLRCFFTVVILFIVIFIVFRDYFTFSCMIFQKKKEKLLSVRPYWILRRTGEELLAQQSLTAGSHKGLLVEFQMQLASCSKQLLFHSIFCKKAMRSREMIIYKLL